MMKTLIQDFRHGLLQLRSDPRFANVVTTALGIAVATAMFSVVSAAPAEATTTMSTEVSE